MKRIMIAALGFLGTTLAAAQGCGGGDIPIGQQNGQLGALDAGTGLCGSSACAAGELCCAGTDAYCTPTCMAVAQCPALGRACKVDAGGESDAGSVDSGSTDAGPPTDAGDCCPSNYSMYTCTFPDGGKGYACHNPMLGCASSSTCGQGCDPVVTGQCGGTADAGTPCGTSTCTSAQTCCTGMPFTTPTCVDGTVCPISQREKKKDINYLSTSDEQRLSEELLSFPLATYRYKTEAASDREHLGFIIDDVAPSPAVMPSGERVDIYGYASMIVATLQVQDKHIQRLEKELAETRAACAQSRGR